MVHAGIANYTYNATRVLPLDTLMFPPSSSEITHDNTTISIDPPSNNNNNNNNNNSNTDDDIESNSNLGTMNSSFTLEEAYSSTASSQSNSNNSLNICGYNENREGFRRSSHLNTEQYTVVSARTLSIDVDVCNTPPVIAVTIPTTDTNKRDLLHAITHPLISLRPRIPLYEVTQAPVAHAQPLSTFLRSQSS